jgi:hypothetical protein
LDDDVSRFWEHRLPLRLLLPVNIIMSDSIGIYKGRSYNAILTYILTNKVLIQHWFLSMLEWKASIKIIIMSVQQRKKSQQLLWILSKVVPSFLIARYPVGSWLYSLQAHH